MPSLLRDDDVYLLNLGDGENRFTRQWMEELGEQLGTLRNDPAPLVTTASGKFWSNGLDLAWLQDNPTEFQSYVSDAQHLLAAVLELPIPTVAAIQGHAFAAGAMLSLCHDVRVMRADRGWWCLPEVDLELPFTPGMNALVTSKLGPQAANLAMTTGHRFGGEAAEAARIVDLAVGEEDVLTTAIALARDRIGKAPGALGQIKSRMYVDVLGELRGTL